MKSFEIISALLFCAILLCVTLGVAYSKKSFFGAEIDSNYMTHFNGKLKCAYVVGWHKERKCLCFLTEDDLRIKDKTFIASKSKMCEDRND